MRWRVVSQLVTLIDDYLWLRFNLDFSESMLSIDSLRLSKTQLAVVPQSEVTGELAIGCDEKGSTINDCLKKYGLNPSATALRDFLNNNEAIAEFVRVGPG